jgi:hypothetical protein
MLYSNGPCPAWRLQANTHLSSAPTPRLKFLSAEFPQVLNLFLYPVPFSRILSLTRVTVVTLSSMEAPGQHTPFECPNSPLVCAIVSSRLYKELRRSFVYYTKISICRIPAGPQPFSLPRSIFPNFVSHSRPCCIPMDLVQHGGSRPTHTFRVPQLPVGLCHCVPRLPKKLPMAPPPRAQRRTTRVVCLVAGRRTV